MRAFLYKPLSIALLCSFAACASPHERLGRATSEPLTTSTTTGSVAPNAPPPSATSAALLPPIDLYVDPAAFDFSKNEELPNRILESPHNYFRFINLPFSKAVCERYTGEISTMARAPLHGDAHLEQYVVSEVGRGLADYDDASFGPPILDFLRFATSVRLALAERGWTGKDNEVISAFFKGYRDGVEGRTETQEPALAKRLLATFSDDRAAFLSSSEKAMVPLAKEEEARARTLFASFEKKMASRFKAPYLVVKKLGGLKSGIGSALQAKYLFRVEGPSKKPADDRIIELKQIRDTKTVPCVDSAVRVTRELGKRADDSPELGPVMLDEGFMVNEWFANYKELKIKKNVESVQDLVEISANAGAQLGREYLSAPIGSAKRATSTELLALAAWEPRVIADSATFAAATVAARDRFRAALGTRASKAPNDKPTATPTSKP